MRSDANISQHYADDLSACAEIVNRGDPDRFAAVMAASPATRTVLFPIYALNVEVARAPWVTEESMIAEMRLQWWRDALAEIKEGKDTRRHNVVSPLASVLDEHAAGVLDLLVEARRWDIYKDPFQDFKHFERYLDQTSGALMYVAARALGDIQENIARDVGVAMGLSNWFRAIPALEARNRVPLVDGRHEALIDLARTGLERLERARRSRRVVNRHVGQAFFAAWQTETILKQVINQPCRVADGVLGISAFSQKSSLMFRAFSGRW